MKLLKSVFKRIAKIFSFVLPTEEQKKGYGERKEAHYNSRLNETTYNPATGLPMIGAHDSNGNMYGSSASDRNTWDDYSSRNCSYSSSYDPFTNRY